MTPEAQQDQALTELQRLGQEAEAEREAALVYLLYKLASCLHPSPTAHELYRAVDAIQRGDHRKGE